MADPRWANVEKFLRLWLAAETGRAVYTETDGTLAGNLPAYQITRVGGSDGADFSKSVSIEIDSIAATRGAMWDAAAAVQTAMRKLAANGTADWYVDTVEETFSPAIEPYENQGVRRATATYALTIRPLPHNETP
jgi:hypothetical protein